MINNDNLENRLEKTETGARKTGEDEGNSGLRSSKFGNQEDTGAEETRMLEKVPLNG